jgi:hypothetical protein
MENITLQAQILSLRSSVDAALTTARQDRQPPGPQARWAPGDLMAARVEAALPGGRFHVKVDDLLLEMNLPDGFKAGDRLELQFVSQQPRPSFMLLTAPPPQRQDVELSRGAKALGEILKTVAPDKSSQAATVRAPQPLLPAPAADAPQIAAALSKALSGSGVFYESHQSQWVLGQRPMSDLLQEPQGKLSPALHDNGVSHDARTASSFADRSTAAASLGLSEDIRTAAAGDRPSAAMPVHQDAMPQVRNQLQALETQQLVWQGQLWPGQDMEWSIRDPGEQHAGPAEVQPWFTQLRLRLPKLGALTADLALVDRTLRLRLVAPAADAQQSMQGAHEALASALSAAGIDLISFKVSGDGGH